MSNNILNITTHPLANDTDTTGWLRISDWKYQHQQARTIIGELTAGDTLKVEITHGDPNEPDFSDYPIAVKNYTDASFDDVIQGPVKFIRVTKVGATGAAKVSLAI